MEKWLNKKSEMEMVQWKLVKQKLVKQKNG